jgi:hypothetical protein
MQRAWDQEISTSAARLSGLWHHPQRSGQPFRNTVVRIPGPSWIEYFWILNTNPVYMPWRERSSWCYGKSTIGAAAFAWARNLHGLATAAVRRNPDLAKQRVPILFTGVRLGYDGLVLSLGRLPGERGKLGEIRQTGFSPNSLALQ